MRIFEDASYSFIKNRRTAYLFSGILLVLSLIALVGRGLELGIDFQGGMEFVLEGTEDLEAIEVRQALSEAMATAPEVKTYGQTGLLVRTTSQDSVSAIESRVTGTMQQAFPDASPTIVKTNVVGPSFAADLAEGAVYSILGALLVVFVYILIRFEWRFGAGAVAALFHDVTITIGIFALFHDVLPFSLQIDQSIIAAFLTIVGYSLNDTVVVFDRVREYENIFRTETYDDIVNRGINSTLSRTIITSGTTLLVVVTLFIFGGEVLRGFSFALIVGVIVGTYSSIFVASASVVELRKIQPKKQRRRRRFARG